MATIEPGQQFQWDQPTERAWADAAQIREMFNALARNNYTTNPTYPSSPRQGMSRVNAEDPNNVKWQVWHGDPGAWRTLVQHLHIGVPAPVKQIIHYPVAGTVWTVDHNLGSQPLAQVFSLAFDLIPQVPNTAQQVHVGHVPSAVLGSRVGVQPLRSAFPMPGAGVVNATRAVVAETILGAPNGQLQFTLSGGGGPMAGGVIPIVLAGLGQVLPGNPVTGNNLFSIGDTLLVETSFILAPLAGALDVYVDVVPAGGYLVNHPTENQIVVTHPGPATGYLVLIG